jgi:hypothetical protein
MKQQRSARSWLLEVSLAVLATLLGLFFVHESVSNDDSYPVVADLIAGVFSFAGLVLFRRSRPVALTLVLILPGLVLGLPMGATPIALFSVALHRRKRVAIALTVLHAVLLATFYGLALGLTREYYEAVAFLVLLHVSLVAVGMLIRSQRQLVASWAERLRQAEEGQRLRVEQARHAYRILQEALTNARKHSPGAPVRVEVDIAYRSGITLRVDNPLAAPAFDLRWLPTAPATRGPVATGSAAHGLVNTGSATHAPVNNGSAARGPVATGSVIPGAGAGLVGLRERVELVGGRLAHGPTAAGEFNLEAWLPWQT